MLKDGINGFCMALADSVPGVSGGTIAFIMGFYDRFIGSVHDLVFGKWEEKKSALLYLAKLGIGWAVGMLLAVAALSTLFESHIYAVSSLFIGFIAGAIPLIIKEEKQSLREKRGGILFCLAGILIVAGITWANNRVPAASMDLGQFSIALGIRLFLIGMIAISAMFLPGISGSTLLLIFGAYIPVITAVKEILSFHLSYLPCLIFFWMRGTDRGCNDCKRDKGLPGTVPPADHLHGFRDDGRFFLRDRHGTDNSQNTAGCLKLRKFSYSFSGGWGSRCIGNADYKRKKCEKRKIRKGVLGG